MRPGSLHRVNGPAEVHAPIVIEILKGGVLEKLASADASVVHEQVDPPEALEGRRQQGTATFRGGNVSVMRDCFASTCPNEVCHLFREPGVLPEPRYVRAQVVHHDPGTAFGEKFDVRPAQPAACPCHNRDLSIQRDSFSHLALLLGQCEGSSHGSNAKALGQHGGRRPPQRRTRATLATAPKVPWSWVRSHSGTAPRARPI